MNKTTDQLRKAWRRHHEEHSRVYAEWAARGYMHPPPNFPILPHELAGLACGARTRAGTPCKMTSIYLNGRCKLHGGLSTGPTSPEGKARAALNGRKPKTKRTP